MTSPTHRHVSRGGLWAHVCRRFFHLGVFILLPWLYFSYFTVWSRGLGCQPTTLLDSLMLVVVLLEAIRLKCRYVLWGMRDYEAHQVSAMAWGALAVMLTVSLSPAPGYAYALCWTCAWVDPMVGELKSYLPNVSVYAIAVLVAALIWFYCVNAFSLPVWTVWVCAPVAVAAEYPRLKFLDDNFLMLVVPLCFLWLFRFVGWL